MTEIEKVKAEIKLLESKLSFLEELSQTKTPCEEAFKRVYGRYPMTDVNDTCWDGSTWIDFKFGYNSAQEDYQVGENQPYIKKPETLYDIFEDFFKDYGYDHPPIEDIVEQVARWLPEPKKDYRSSWHDGWNSFRQTLIDTLGGE